MVRAWYETYGLPIIITNCSNNYGPYQFPEKLIPTVILNAISGKPVPVYGDGLNVRDWIYVDDHVRALWKVANIGKPYATYNIGAESEKTNISIVKAICSILDEILPESEHCPHADLITFVDDRPGHDRRYAINSSRIKNETGWHPDETFEDALRKTIHWYLNNKAWVQRILNGAYRGERLGLSHN